MKFHLRPKLMKIAKMQPGSGGSCGIMSASFESYPLSSFGTGRSGGVGTGSTQLFGTIPGPHLCFALPCSVRRHPSEVGGALGSEMMLRRFVEISLAGPGAVNATIRAPDRVRDVSLIAYRRKLVPRSSMTTGASRQNRYDALLLDAGGTLLQTASPVAETYAAIGKKYGIEASASEIKEGFKRAFSATWPEQLRYQGDGRPFWRHVVSQATGCSNNEYFEEVYEHFARSSAWRLPSGAYEVLHNLKDDGVKLAVVSNFDTRLRKLLEGLNISNLFDAIVVSAEIGYEKPAAEIFRAALDQLCVGADKAVHVGDDLKADKSGANAVGINCWLWGTEVKSFDEIYNRIMNVAVQK